MTAPAAIASIVLCLQGANSSAAEPAPRKHHIGFGLGTSLFRERDELASPLAYQGLLFGGSLSYEYRGERQDHWAYLGLGGGTLKAAIAKEAYPPGTDRGSGALAYANIRYGYHHVVYRLSEGRLDLSAGAVLDMASHDFKPSGASSIIWLTTYSLDVGVMARYQPASRHTLVARMFSPFLTYLGRPAWSILDSPTGNMSVAQLLSGGQTEVTSLNGYRAVTARFDYEYRFSPRWSGTASYELTYRNSSILEPVHSLQNSVFLGLSVGN